MNTASFLPRHCQKVLLVCADAENEGMGRKLLAQLPRQPGQGNALQIVVWFLSRLGSPSCKMLATMDYVEAQLIVVAAARNEEFSSEAKMWIKQWPPSEHGRTKALITVFGGTDPVDVSTWPDHGTLRQAADRCGLQYSVFSTGNADAKDLCFSACETSGVKPQNHGQVAP